MDVASMGAPKRKTVKLPGTIRIVGKVPKRKGRKGRKVATTTATAIVPATVEVPAKPKARSGWIWLLVVAAGVGAVWYLVKQTGKGRRRRRRNGLPF